jgi:hypothetical protein
MSARLQLTFAQTQDDATATWKPVGAALGRSGQMQPGEVYKFALPRRDMKVVKEGLTVAPGLALGSWVAFKKMGNEAMVMGDLVLTEEKIEPVMLKLQQEGIEQTSIHSHLLGESSHVIYTHIEGHGDPVALAHSLASAVALTKTPPPATTAPATAQPTIDLKTTQVEQALGYSGKVSGGILQFSVPRPEKIRQRDGGTTRDRNCYRHQLPTCRRGKAAILGDFVLLANEVNPVVRALRAHGIEVEAMHNHMLNDQPHLYFMHFSANDDAVKSAQGLRAALDETNSQKPQVK